MSLAVSLLIPAYNATRFIGNIVSDARAQTAAFAEILVYDDASGDGTAEKAKSLGVDHVIEGHVNKGPSFARNRLLQEASCPWIHFHDADDRLDPDYVRAVTTAAPRPDEMLFCGLRVHDAQAQKDVSSYTYTHLNGVSDLDAFLQTSFQVGCGLYPADALRAIGGFREDIRGGEDLDLHVRLIHAGVKFRAIPDLLSVYCRYGNVTFTETNVGRLHSDLSYVYEQYLRELPPAHHPLVAKLVMEQAFKLYANCQFAECDHAIEVARGAGRRTVASSHAAIRLLSAVVGVKPVFWARHHLSHLLRQSAHAKRDRP